jgi:two-component system phosphate regulon sensor histidine kinase PhoR
MKRSIFFKIFAGYIAVAIVLTVLILGLSFRAIRSSYVSALTDDLVGMGTVLNTRLQPFIEKNDRAGLDAYVKDIDVRIHRRITVIDAAGTVIADSEYDTARMENHAGRPEVQRALAGSVGSAIRPSPTLGETMLYVALPLSLNGRTPAVSRLSIPIKDVNSILGRLRIAIAQLSLIALLISLLAAYLISRGISRPVIHIGRAARKVAGGDLAEKVPLRGADELRDLAESFNDMTGQLQASFAGLARQKEELHTIIASLSEGLCVIGGDDRILLCNSAFATAVDQKAAEGRFIWEVLRAPRFRELLESARTAAAAAEGEIELEGSVYLCGITVMAAKREYIVILHDITQRKLLENVKKDFVANVSHELRTPLTAIKGYLETIDGASAAESRSYIDIIRRNTERLIRIVEDLLLLSELESPGFHLEPAMIAVRPFLENVARIFGPRISAAGLQFELDVAPEAQNLKGDAFKLEQVFINLLDNAVKYTEKGSIRVQARREASAIAIMIEDTGIGIPIEHIPRIFERFYVVDKSRSRTAGGTGLGLSIVKHIVLLHNGSIDITSVRGAGTCVTVRLPAA